MGFFRAEMSLDQSPLATLGGAGSGRWAMLQRHQGAGGGYNTNRVHKELVFTVIVTRPLMISIFLRFTYTYEKVVRLGASGRWIGDLQKVEV